MVHQTAHSNNSTQLFNNGRPWVLGLDPGVASLGWAIVDAATQRPLMCGARIFPAGLEGDIENGKGKSRAEKRRLARLTRRQLKRRAQRKQNVASQLISDGLLPEFDHLDHAATDRTLKSLDIQLQDETEEDGENPHLTRQVWLFRLRARALDHPLTDHELGRIIYQFAQRRGFKSNRKLGQMIDLSGEAGTAVITDAETELSHATDEELGKVATGILSLQSNIEATGSRTLGEYFAKHVDPETERIRKRWTARSMYEEEFEAIFEAQRHLKNRDAVSIAKQQRYHHLLFHQRPLKSQRDKIGKCPLEGKTTRRAAVASDAFQRFRVLDSLNNLRIINPDGEETRLDAIQFETLYSQLTLKEERLSAAQIRDLLEIPGLRTKTGRRWALSIEQQKPSRILGHVTNARMRKSFGDRWHDFEPDEQYQALNDLATYDQPERLIQRGIDRWQLDGESAHRLAYTTLEPGYASYSARAMRRINKQMAEQKDRSASIRDIYPDHNNSPTVDRLPPVAEGFSTITSPLVRRSLTEVRKVVNDLIQRLGSKPDVIRLELARDLKQSAKRKAAASERNEKNRRENEKLNKRLQEEFGILAPSGTDRMKLRLAIECGFCCPYTSITIDPNDLFNSGRWDIEHIIPRGQGGGDEFTNKTLCLNEFNRNTKGKSLPSEVFAPDSDEWAQAVSRVERFTGNARIRNEKLRRFKATSNDIESIYPGFSDGMLQDTQYTARCAAAYLGQLYGGDVDASGRRRVQAVPGRSTSLLRREWGLNQTLHAREDEKNRDDHRHHAIDAAVIACTSPGTVHRIAKAAAAFDDDRTQRTKKYRGRRGFAPIVPPCDDFAASLQACIEQVSVSHRPNRSIGGALHNETLHSPPKEGKSGATVFHTRKPINELTASMLSKVVDPRIKDAIEQKLSELGTRDCKKAFADPCNHPLHPNDPLGRRIHRCRIVINKKSNQIGVTPGKRRGLAERWVQPAGNAYMLIIGGDSPTYEVVSRLDAHRQLHNSPDKRHKSAPTHMKIFPGDTIEIDDPSSKARSLVWVRSLSSFEVFLCRHQDARKHNAKQAAKEGLRIRTLKKFLGLNPIRVEVSPSGVVYTIGHGSKPNDESVPNS